MIRAIIALCLAIVVWGTAQGEATGRMTEQWGSVGIEWDGVISAFSCDPNPNNPMGACTTFANGGSVEGAVMTAACPREYLNQRLYVEGYGSVFCADTPARGWYGDTIHVDIFMGTGDGAHERAVQWGIQYREVRR